jgi:hypothetical protein
MARSAGARYSLAETAARDELGMELSVVAVFKRLRAYEEWLRWLAEQLRGRQRLAVESQGQAVRALDATTVSEPGSTGTDWCVHYVVNLAHLPGDLFELTKVGQLQQWNADKTPARLALIRWPSWSAAVNWPLLAAGGFTRRAGPCSEPTRREKHGGSQEWPPHHITARSAHER